MRTTFRESHLPTVLLLSLFFGTNLVVSRFAIGQMHPLVYAAARMPFATLFAFALTLIRHRRFPRGRNLWVHGTVVGIFATAAPMVFFVSSLSYQSSGVTSLFITLTPIAAMIYAHFLLKDDRMTLQKVLGAVVSFGGVGLLVATGETGLGQSRWEGFVLVLIGVACNGFGIVHVRRHLSQEHSLDITSVRLLVGTVLIAPLPLFVGGYDFSRVEWSGGLALAYGVLAGTLGGFLLYSHAASRFGPSRATQTEYIVPIITVFTGAIFLGERITPIIMAGMILAIAGIVLATWQRRITPPGNVLRR